MKHIHLLAIAAIILVSSCHSGGKSDGAPVRIAVLRGPSSVAMVKMMDSLARFSGAAISIEMFDEPLQLRKMMLEGEADYAVLPMTMAALMYNKGLDYRVAAVPLWGTLSLCGTDSSIKCIRDLKGRRVHLMAKGMTPDIMFRHLLARNGLVPDKDVQLDYRFPTHIDMANAAIASRTPLCILTEPFTSQAIRMNTSLHLLLDLGEEWSRVEGIPMAETAFLCKGVLAGDKMTEELVRDYGASAGWALAHPDSAAFLAVQFGINPDAEAVEKSIPRSNFNVKPARDAESEIKSYLRVFLGSAPESIGEKMPDEDFYVK